MQCEKCQSREATIHIQEVIGDQSRSFHLCAECAASQGVPNGDAWPNLDPSDLHKLLQAIAEHAMSNDASAPDSAPAAPAALACPECGLRESEVRKTARFGCPTCYRTFARFLDELLPTMHRGTRHLGRKPDTSREERVSIRLKLLEYERGLAEAVAREQYEKAALLRDRIAKLRQELPEAALR